MRAEGIAWFLCHEAASTVVIHICVIVCLGWRINLFRHMFLAASVRGPVISCLAQRAKQG
jgi:hypothetical protein